MAMPGRRSTSKGDFRFVDVHVGARLRRRRAILQLIRSMIEAPFD
jgi:hypothetical protein